MIDHVSLGTTRYAAAVDFYRQVLAPLAMFTDLDGHRIEVKTDLA